MLYWLSFIIIALFFSFISVDKKFDDNLRMFAKICLIFVLVYFAGFRDGLGHDYDGYYDLLINGSFNEYTFKEPGFSLFSNVVYHTELSPVFFFLIMAIITNYLFITSFYRYKNIFLIIFIYLTVSIYYFNTFNLVRQMAAASIFMYSIRFVEERKFLHYLLCILLATSFHTSAIYLLPIYFIVNRNYSNRSLLIILNGSIIIGQLLKLDLSSFMSKYLTLYYWYFDGNDDTVYESGYLTLLFNIVLILLIIYKKKDEDVRYKVALNLFFIGVILYNLIPSFYFIFRFAAYFIIFAPIILPSLNVIFPKKIWESILIFIFGGMFIFMLYSNSDNPKVIPNSMLDLEKIFDN